MEAQPQFLSFTIELLGSPVQKDHEAAYNLHRDWQFARCRLWAELVTKLWYFRQLPWHLLGMAHHDKIRAMQAAKDCLQMFDSESQPGRTHRQSLRFLDASFVGDDQEDVPLRPLVEEFSREGDLGHERMRPLVRWLGRLTTIRVGERSVEAIHSVMTRTYKRATAASLWYVSCELRLQQLLETLTETPEAS